MARIALDPRRDAERAHRLAVGTAQWDGDRAEVEHRFLPRDAEAVLAALEDSLAQGLTIGQRELRAALRSCLGEAGIELIVRQHAEQHAAGGGRQRRQPEPDRRHQTERELPVGVGNHHHLVADQHPDEARLAGHRHDPLASRLKHGGYQIGAEISDSEAHDLRREPEHPPVGLGVAEVDQGQQHTAHGRLGEVGEARGIAQRHARSLAAEGADDAQAPRERLDEIVAVAHGFAPGGVGLVQARHGLSQESVRNAYIRTPIALTARLSQFGELTSGRRTAGSARRQDC